jgi:hypothetical protein
VCSTRTARPSSATGNSPAAFARSARLRRTSAVIHAIAGLDIGVLVLTEFVDGDHHIGFKNSLKDLGLDSLVHLVRVDVHASPVNAARRRFVIRSINPL